MSEQTITCEECTGGFVEEEGLQKPCPVCDGDPIVTFATVKELSRQIGYFSRKLWLAESELGTVTFATVEELSRQIGYFSRKLWLAESELGTVRRQLGEALARTQVAASEVIRLEQWKREALESMKAWDALIRYLSGEGFEVKDWGGTCQEAVLRRLKEASRVRRETLKSCAEDCEAAAQSIQTCLNPASAVNELRYAAQRFRKLMDEAG